MTHPAIAEAARMFAIDIADHDPLLVVDHDDGVYRHLRFRRPDTGLYWFELVTWPGSLCFHGDMGTLVFSRLNDMVEFFTSSHTINPTYWGEKIQVLHGSPAEQIYRYDEERLEECVAGQFDAWAARRGYPLADVRDCWAAVEDEVLANAADGEREALACAERFTFLEANPVTGLANQMFGFTDTWEWPVRTYSPRFLWVCWAILWSVNRYLGKPTTLPKPEDKPQVSALHHTPVRPREQTANPDPRYL